MKKTILAFTLIAASSTGAFSQILSPGAWSGGGGDYTGVINPQLKLQSNGINGYVRAVHLSLSSSISTVYNYQTGKDVYWGESNDNGNYFFRGRDVIVQNGDLGVGTTSPTNKLHVVGSARYDLGTDMNLGISGWQLAGTGGMTIQTYNDANTQAKPLAFSATKFYFHSGNVGIGTANPDYPLDIQGATSTNDYPIYLRGGTDVNHGLGWYSTFASTSIDGPVLFGYSGGALGSTNGGQKKALTWNNNGQVTIDGSSDAKLSVLTSNNTDYAALIQNGGGSGQGLYIKGGVSGSSQPEYALLRVANYNGDDILMVEGAKKRVYAREIVVNLASWPDYVFKSEYELKSLDEVEAFIEENSHLPGVPSEEVIVNGGVNLGQMDAILLEKIEELTLYMIELKKENQELRTAIENK